MQRIAKETMKYQELWNTQITDNNSNVQERQAKRTLQNFETNDFAISFKKTFSNLGRDVWIVIIARSQ